MMWAIWIGLGVFIGALLPTIFMIWVYFRVQTIAKGESSRIVDHAEKMVMARKYFGLIANRESIGEARKIANKALKELEK